MPIDMNQTIAQASLDNLHDIIVPDAVGFFPVAPGWIITGALLLTLLFHFALREYQYYKKTRYKREALQELKSYTMGSREEIVLLLALAKRVGIAAYGRGKVAKLDGEHWWDFMEQHSSVKVSRAFRDHIAILLYDENTQEQGVNFKEVKSIVVDWVKTHKAIHNA